MITTRENQWLGINVFSFINWFWSEFLSNYYSSLGYSDKVTDNYL